MSKNPILYSCYDERKHRCGLHPLIYTAHMLSVKRHKQWGNPQFTLIPSKNFRNAFVSKEVTDAYCVLVYNRLKPILGSSSFYLQKISYYLM